MGLKEGFALVRDSGKDFIEDDCPTQAAALCDVLTTMTRRWAALGVFIRFFDVAAFSFDSL